MLFLAFAALAGAVVYAPRHHYSFNSTALVNADNAGVSALNLQSGAYTFHGNSGAVGGAVEWTANTPAIQLPKFANPEALSVEFYFKPSRSWNIKRRSDFLNCGYVHFSLGAYEGSSSRIRFQYRAGGRQLYAPLTETGRLSYEYYLDGAFHHFAGQYEPRLGKMRIWVDGQIIASDSFAPSGGALVDMTSGTYWFFNHNVHYAQTYGVVDEIALYTQALPDILFYEHGRQVAPYTFSFNPSAPVPPPTPTSTATFDLLEYMAGTQLPTAAGGKVTQGVTIEPIEQLRQFPAPRFATQHTLRPLYEWVDVKYLAGLFQPYRADFYDAYAHVAELSEEMADMWHYAMSISIANDYGALGSPSHYVADLAKARPELPLVLTTARAGFRPHNLSSVTLPASCYLQNAAGQFLDTKGNTYSSPTTLRPTSTRNNNAAVCLDSTFDDDIAYLQGILSNLFSYLGNSRGATPLYMMNDNGEYFYYLQPSALLADPVVAADMALGGESPDEYQGKWRARLTLRYVTGVYQAYSTALAGTPFNEYEVTAHYGAEYWQQIRLIQTPLRGAERYETPSLYTRFVDNWRYGVSSWFGLDIIGKRRTPAWDAGDEHFSPFVAAGWSKFEEDNIRPAQWLGLLKICVAWGAEFFYTGHFIEDVSNLPIQDPRNYVWQVAAPAYVQAAASHAEALLMDGVALEGDRLLDQTQLNGGYMREFWTGDLQCVVAVRQAAGGVKRFLIIGSVQPSSTMQYNAPLEKAVSIELDGEMVRFNVRRQGSMYVYDKTSAAQRVFYQLDAWHEWKHFWHWSRDWRVEAELYDVVSAPTFVIRTEGSAGTSDFSQFTSYVTAIGVVGASTAPAYTFETRSSSASTLYVWLRARSTRSQGTRLALRFDGGVIANVLGDVGVASAAAFAWCRVPRAASTALLSGVSHGKHVLSVAALDSGLELDELWIVASASFVPASGASNCPIIGGSTTPSPSPFPTSTPSPTAYPSPFPTSYPSPFPTSTPSPTAYPSPFPTSYPSPFPTSTAAPTAWPTPFPTTTTTSSSPAPTASPTTSSPVSSPTPPPVTSLDATEAPTAASPTPTSSSALDSSSAAPWTERFAVPLLVGAAVVGLCACVAVAACLFVRARGGHRRGGLPSSRQHSLASSAARRHSALTSSGATQRSHSTVFLDDAALGSNPLAASARRRSRAHGNARRSAAFNQLSASGALRASTEATAGTLQYTALPDATTLSEMRRARPLPSPSARGGAPPNGSAMMRPAPPTSMGGARGGSGIMRGRGGARGGARGRGFS